MDDYSLKILKTAQSPNQALAAALGKVLEQKQVDGVVAPGKSKESGLPMPMLFTGSQAINSCLPLAPVAGVSTAVQAARLGRNAQKRRLAVVVKPCELRALIELAKLNQTSLDSMVLISMQCPGRMENSVYLEHLEKNPDLPDKYLHDSELQALASPTCLSCDLFEPHGADLIIHLPGIPVMEQLGISAPTQAGIELAAAMDLEESGQALDQAEALTLLREKRSLARQELFKRTREIIQDQDRFPAFLGNCLGCFNCRTACPVCYCRECVCAREAFDRELPEVMARADRSGMARLPAALGMFHLTRLTHMAHACIGCGQCSSVCPSGIPVADLFRTLGAEVQKTLDYSPGRDPEEPIPYLRFKSEAGS